MKYLLLIPSGFSLNEDALTELPEGAIQVTDEQAIGLRDGTLTLKDGDIVNV
jgi:hypothetical protein